MVNLWKRSVEWVTGLKSNLFTWARIKLSVLYLLIIAVILILFTAGIYASFQDRFRDVFRINRPEEHTLYDHALDDIRNEVLLVDAIVFVISAGLSYILAGYTLKPIKNALEAQAAFTADASHELRTPLAVMRTNTEIILRGDQTLPDTTKKLLKTNIEEITAVSTMAEQLLALSRGQESHNVLFKKIDLAKITKNAVEKFQYLATEKNIELDLGKIDTVYVQGNIGSLERMLNNIIANALAYTPERGSINVSLLANSKTAKLIISDTGIGIPAKDLPNIFKRFYKADTARTATEAGSGLGLAIVKQIVEKHHGSIEIKSKINEGTTVEILIPIVD